MIYENALGHAAHLISPEQKAEREKMIMAYPEQDRKKEALMRAILDVYATIPESPEGQAGLSRVGLSIALVRGDA